ncbi:MAG TPA: argininosuccinate lyase [Terriglobales bacterium]|nr:argininosuccinate lyase [Terriglobales bacterium]
MANEKLWGGRFTQPAAAEFERFSESFSFDRRLLRAEIRGSRAYARALERAGVLAAGEAAALAAALDRLEQEAGGASGAAEAGAVAPEDVHTFVAQRLEQLAGPAARKLQTGRSRNEQVALDLRLYLLDRRGELEGALAGYVAALARFAAEHAEVLIPGYTHLQRAQPVSLGHHALAYAEMLLRDAGRLADAYRRLAVLPLGSGALAGTPLAVDRAALAAELGMSAASQNSLDAVSDRDFAAELLFALALAGVHLSRWAEDWIFYSSAECGWLALGDQFASGSSLMPQKKNPDALELIRGKAARQIGSLLQLLTLLKSLPLAYNRDLQEDKEPVFDALDTAIASLRVAAGVVATTAVRRERAAAAAADPALLATDLADLLVEAGVAFRDAHELVGQLIARTVDQGRDFRQLTDDELRAWAPQIEPARVRDLSAAASVARRAALGGTAPAQVRAQAARVAKLAADLQTAPSDPQR